MSTPNPIPHLITAVSELSFALRDLYALAPVATAQSVHQDSFEHASELETLLRILLRKLADEGYS